MATFNAIDNPQNPAVRCVSSSKLPPCEEGGMGSLSLFLDEVVCAPKDVLAISPGTNMTNPNIDIALAPRGTGAFSLDVPDNTVAGGNCRGDNAVDGQMVRTAATQVASGDRSFIGGGQNNVASGGGSTVGGGNGNTSSDNQSTVGGGLTNRSLGNQTFVGGGITNTASANQSTVGGGINNRSLDNQTFVGGGLTNTASNSQSTVGGGISNRALGAQSFVGGGNTNTASDPNSAVCGGVTNRSLGTNSFIGGGITNTASAIDSAVCGGITNRALAVTSFVGGGVLNTASGLVSAVCGGGSNRALADSSFIAGGTLNTIAVGSGLGAIGGGSANIITTLDGFSNVIAGGVRNVISGGSVTRAAIGGGFTNSCTGDASCVPGGDRNRCDGAASLACGTLAADGGNTGCFVFSDVAGGGITAADPNTFVVQAGGPIAAGVLGATGVHLSIGPTPILFTSVINAGAGVGPADSQGAWSYDSTAVAAAWAPPTVNTADAINRLAIAVSGILVGPIP